jgi:hypothetical protein
MGGLQIQARLMMAGRDGPPSSGADQGPSLTLKQEVLLTARRNITKKLNLNPFLPQPDHDLATSKTCGDMVVVVRATIGHRARATL